MGTGEPLTCVCLVRDLMFASKITASGVPVRLVREPAALATIDGTHLVVDLNQLGALDAATAWRARTGRPVTGFVSHVDADTIAAARAAGVDQVLARSAFVRQLPQLLASA